MNIFNDKWRTEQKRGLFGDYIEIVEFLSHCASIINPELMKAVLNNIVEIILETTKI